MILPLQVHSGDPINIDVFISVQNDSNYGSVYRPLYGYWLSDFTVEDMYPSRWMNFIYSNPSMIEYHSRPYYCIYKISDEAKVCFINNYEDLIILILKYPLKVENEIYIDFEKVSEDWDVLYLTEDGFADCKIPKVNKLKEYGFEGSNLPTLKGWEIPSCLVMSCEVLTLIEEKKMSNI